MTLRPNFMSIRAFVAVYEEHSFTAAANRENATQPGISQHVRQLEEMLGVQLFDRSKGHVAPTPAAHAYYNYCVSILKLHCEAVREIQDFRSEIEGEVRVGISPALTQSVIGRAVDAFTRSHPNVALRVHEGYPDTLTKMALGEELDFAITVFVTSRAGLSVKPFANAREVLITRGSSHLPHLQAVSPAQCGPLRLVLPGAHYARRRALDAYFEASGAKVQALMEVESVSASLAVVREGDWCTVLPYVAVAHEAHSGRFNISLLSDPEFFTELSLIEPSRRCLSRASTIFCETLRESTVSVEASAAR